MADRPINLRDHEVRAIKAGAKRQFRRILKPQPTIDKMGNLCAGAYCYGQRLDGTPDLNNPAFRARVVRFAPGDRLLFRETWALNPNDGRTPIYRATDPGWGENGSRIRWRSPACMPRKFVRLFGDVVKVRVQRLREISSADAIAEGCMPHANSQTIDCDTPDPRDDFRHLWNSIHGDDAWAANPWVCAVIFETHRRNIDAMEASHAA